MKLNGSSKRRFHCVLGVPATSTGTEPTMSGRGVEKGRWSGRVARIKLRGGAYPGFGGSDALCSPMESLNLMALPTGGTAHWHLHLSASDAQSEEHC
jgi:hypothetical protein